jgi:hypothetical protein
MAPGSTSLPLASTISANSGTGRFGPTALEDKKKRRKKKKKKRKEKRKRKKRGKRVGEEGRKEQEGASESRWKAKGLVAGDAGLLCALERLQDWHTTDYRMMPSGRYKVSMHAGTPRASANLRSRHRPRRSCRHSPPCHHESTTGAAPTASERASERVIWGRDR